MTIRRGVHASFLAGLAMALVFVFVPAAAAYDPVEFPLAVDAMNTYSADKLAAPTNDGGHDMAVGGGQHGDGGFPDCKNGAGTFGVGTCVNEGFSAQSGPTGLNPKGHVSATFETPHPAKLRGPVLCLDVHGNEAFILVMQQSSDAGDLGFPANDVFLLHVVDYGNPVMGTPPDRIANVGPDDPAFIHASPLIPDYPCGYTAFSVPLQKGNITVRDV